ncbi:MAG: hypothetical protein HY700_16920 [Gemmatimonadetes bacterium]|nr:hypothetical protein [Gemmatimonadota bacterium]
MHPRFKKYVADLDTGLRHLLKAKPVLPAELPSDMPLAGVYLFSERGRHLYVGRSNRLRRRIGRHCRLGATHRMGAFAFRLAREATGYLKATYKTEGSRSALLKNRRFAAAFVRAKARIRRMHVRYVEESDPVKQALLEIYVATVLKTPYNDFDTH